MDKAKHNFLNAWLEIIANMKPEDIPSIPFVIISWGEREREPREWEDEEARRDEERAEKQREETERKANPLPICAIQLVPGFIIECATEAVNVDAVDGAARVIDVVVMTHLKARYKSFYASWSTWMRQSTRRESSIKVPYMNSIATILTSGRTNMANWNLQGKKTWKLGLRRRSPVREKSEDEMRERTCEEHLARESCADWWNIWSRRAWNLRASPQWSPTIPTWGEAHLWLENSSNPWNIWCEELWLLQSQLTNVEDHLHIDPVSIFCAVIKKVRTYSGSLTLATEDLLLPDQLLEQHEAKQQAATKSERQMTAQTAHLDQEERRERVVNYMRAIASGSQEVPDITGCFRISTQKKKARKAK